MSIDYAARIVVGLPVSDIPLEEGVHDMYDIGLEYSHPYFDCGDEVSLGCVIVLSAPDYDYRVLPGNLAELTSYASEKFKRITGLEGKVYLTTHSS